MILQLQTQQFQLYGGVKLKGISDNAETYLRYRRGEYKR